MAKLWVKAKRYGWGWTPVSIEGWLVLAALLLAMAAIAWAYRSELRSGVDPNLATVLLVIALMACIAGFSVVAWLTGERPRWRWGK
jgi:hypothetical protein